MADKKDADYVKLYKAVVAYVKSQGGKVIMCVGVQAQEWYGSTPHEFTIAVKCVGTRPTFADASARSGKQ